jgi:hypothetical protein
MFQVIRRYFKFMAVSAANVQFRFRGNVFRRQQNTAPLLDQFSDLIKILCRGGSSFPPSVPSGVLQLANNTVLSWSRILERDAHACTAHQ